MSRIAQPAEKIMAVASIYKALWVEVFGDPMAEIDPRIQAVMLDIAGRIALATDTRDMGILAPTPMANRDPGDHFGYPEVHEVAPDLADDVDREFR